ncbi:yfkN [Scenedesmus sp. PABB004]|nr:yfkN [Scenedesmus sp. PABB004]
MAAPDRRLEVIHFNDVYNIEAGAQEPIGGAARFVAKVNALRGSLPSPPLVLFSGDAFAPSMLSIQTLGKHMPAVLNAAGVAAACLGNHDLDYGLDNFVSLAAECSFPWLLANVLDRQTGEPLGGARRTLLLDHAGVRVGLVGLAEAEWAKCLSCLEPEELTVLPFIEEGRRAARELRAAGAEVVLALTHMRVPNDLALAAAAPEIDAVLGGHDHHVQVELVQPHGNLLVKSGTDFRQFTHVTVTLPSQSRPRFSWRTHEVRGADPEDAAVAAHVADHAAALGGRLDEVLAVSLTPLDGRFDAVRSAESNLGSLFCDVLRRACSADVCILNSGTFRSDVVHPAGPFTLRDLLAVLPMMDDSVVLEVTGAQLLAALENGVSAWPKREGRFPQVSGVRFSYDPSRPPGARVLPGSVTVGSERAPLDPGARYALATKAFLAEGKDGFDVLLGSRVLLDAEVAPQLPTVLRNYARMLEPRLLRRQVLNLLDPTARVGAFAKRWAQARKNSGRDRATDLIATGNCVRHPVSGRFVVAPTVDGRITRVGGSDAAGGGGGGSGSGGAP